MKNKNPDEMMKDVLSNEKMREKMLLDFGYDNKRYSDEEIAYITYVIMQLGGLTDKVKSSKALYLITEIANKIIGTNDYEEVGEFVVNLLAEHKVVKFTE